MKEQDIIKQKAKNLLETKPKNDGKGTVFYPCNGDWGLISYFSHHADEAINAKLLDPNSSFKITMGHDSSSYRGQTIHKRGAVLYKYATGGKLSAEVEAYLIRPNPKNPKQPRLCRFLSLTAGRFNSIPGITVTKADDIHKVYQDMQAGKREHPLFPFALYEDCATGLFQMIQKSILSDDEQKKYAKVKRMIISIELGKWGKELKSNDFAAAIGALALPALKADLSALSTEMKAKISAAPKTESPEARDARQQGIWAKIDQAFKADQDSKDTATAEGFVPKTIEELVLKMYYLNCQLELDDDVACDIFKTWFAKNPEDSKNIEQLIAALYVIRVDQGRLGMNIVYSKSEITTVLTQAVKLESEKSKDDTLDALDALDKKDEPKAKEAEKLKASVSGDPSLFAPKVDKELKQKDKESEEKLKQATIFLKKTLSPHDNSKTPPGKWYALRDESKAIVFEIGVSNYTKKPGLVYDGYQIQLEKDENSPFTVLNKETGFETTDPSAAAAQIIKTAKALEAYQTAKAKLKPSTLKVTFLPTSTTSTTSTSNSGTKQSENCLVM